MASFLKIFSRCIPFERGIQLPTKPEKYQHLQEEASCHPSLSSGEKQKISCYNAAASIASAIWDADQHDGNLRVTIDSFAHQAGGWSEYLADKVRLALEELLKAGKQMNAAMQEAYDKACEAAKVIEGFAADHPTATAVFCTVIAIGILVIIAPYVVELLGFSELGPVEGESPPLMML